MDERTLLILRHAKAVRESAGGDRARPLNDRGLANASAVGRWLLAEGLIPDRVLCSTAARTRQTWQQVAASLGEAGGRSEVSFDDRTEADAESHADNRRAGSADQRHLARPIVAHAYR